MSSVLFIVPAEHAPDYETWRGAVTFIGRIKGIFGRELCDTDGSIGYPTEFGPEQALAILQKCEPEYGSDSKDLMKVQRWAKAGKRLFAVWRH